MKKILPISLVLTLMLSILCIFPASAENTEFAYRILDDGTAEVTRYAGYEQKVAVPAEIGGYTVTEIGEEAFYGKKNIIEVTLPDTIRKIGRCAFFENEKLQKINLPESLTYIGDLAFNHCVFLESVTLSEGLTYIGDSAFRWCYKLGYNGLPETLEYIGDDAFYSCEDITSAVIPEGVTYLGDNAFTWCENLSEVSMPQSLEYIGTNPFFKSAYGNDTSNWENGAFYLGDYLLDIDIEMTGEFHIKDGTRILAADAFSHSDLSSVIMPDSVECIGEYCFNYSDRMKEIRLSANLKEIPVCAFRDCSALESITIPEGVTAIRQDAFWDCRNLSYIKLPRSIETMETRAVGYNTLWEFDLDAVYDAGKVKSEILTIAGYKGTAAEKYAEEFGFNFKDLNSRYKSQVLALFNASEEDFGTGGDWLTYHEGYEYYSTEPESTEATPDFVLIELYENPKTNTHEAQAYGDYIIRDSNSYFPETLGYYIYLPEANKIYALQDAFDMGIESVYNVFTEGGIGELIGDVNYDRKLNVKDATLIQKEISRVEFIENNYIPSYTWSDSPDVPSYIGDYNRDGKMNVRDATAIQKHIAGLDKRNLEYSVLEINEVTSASEHNNFKTIATTRNELKNTLARITETVGRFDLDEKFSDEYFEDKAVIVIADKVADPQIVTGVSLLSPTVTVHRLVDTHEEETFYQCLLIEVNKESLLFASDVKTEDTYALICY